MIHLHPWGALHVLRNARGAHRPVDLFVSCKDNPPSSPTPCEVEQCHSAGIILELSQFPHPVNSKELSGNLGRWASTRSCREPQAGTLRGCWWGLPLAFLQALD